MSRTLYIADDERHIRDLIKSFLVNAGYVVEVFETGDSLMQRFQSLPCDLVILDLNMPGTDGLTICSKIREMSHVPIIIVSARHSELDRITGIASGSDDYLVKPFSPSELVVRVNAIFRRMDMFQGAASNLAFDQMVIDEKNRSIKYKGQAFDVTPTEYDLLRYLFKHADRAVSREELLKAVWQFDYDVDTRATDDVVKRLRKKLASTSVRISAVWGYGFKLEVENE